jgi:hypothetical protein
MAILDRFKAHQRSPASSTIDPEKKPVILDVGMKQIFRPRIIAMAIIVSMGGFIFGTTLPQIFDASTNTPQGTIPVRSQDSSRCPTSSTNSPTKQTQKES